MSNNKTLAELTRKDFPLFSSETSKNQNLIYLDHAATSQKPIQVIKDLENYYSYSNANVHRGAHQLSAKATQDFEEARSITANFIGSNAPEEILFTSLLNFFDCVLNAISLIQLIGDFLGGIYFVIVDDSSSIISFFVSSSSLHIVIINSSTGPVIDLTTFT